MHAHKSSLREYAILGYLFRQEGLVFLEKDPKHSTRQQYYVLPEYERPAKYVQTRDPPPPRPPPEPKISISVSCQTLETPVDSHFCQTQPPPAPPRAPAPMQPKRPAVPSAKGSLRHRAAMRIQAMFGGTSTRKTLEAQPKTKPLNSPPVKSPLVKIESPIVKTPPVKPPALLKLPVKSVRRTLIVKSENLPAKPAPVKSPPVKSLTIKSRSPVGTPRVLKSPPPLNRSPLKSILKRSSVPKPSSP